MSKQRPLPFGLPVPPPSWLQKRAGISLCMIVKDEEQFLERCLQSAAGVVDEINIVDTGSTDGTLDIARRFNARIEHRAWDNDFAAARNASLEMASRRWVLQLDADEELCAESIAQLQQLKQTPAHLTGLLVRCSNAADAHGTAGTVSHAITRIFPNHPRVRFRGAIHEFPCVDNASTVIPAMPTLIRITHYGYLDAVIKDRDKLARNMRMVLETAEKEPDDAYSWYNVGITSYVGGEPKRAAEALERMWALCAKNGLRTFAGNGLQVLSSIYTEQLSDPQKGLHFAQECLEIAPHYANAHFAAGKAYAGIGEYERAREMYAAAIADAPHVARQLVVDEDAAGWKPMCEIAATYEAERRWPEALEWAELACALRPDVRSTHLKRAAVLEALQRVDEARGVYETMHRDFADTQSGLAFMNFLLRHDAAAALHFIEENYAAFGDSAQPALSAAVHIAITRKEFARAYAFAQAGLRYTPEDNGLHYSAAIAATNLNEKDTALAHLDRVRRDAGELHERALYLRAVLLRELGQTGAAIESLDALLRVTGPQPDALLLRGALLEASGRKEEAEEAFRRALPLAGKRASIELAAFYLREGRPSDAKCVAEEALAARRRTGLVSIVMLSWNAPQFTKLALQSIRSHTAGNYEVIIVDNGSGPETVEWLKTLTDVRVIFNPVNRGYAAGNNQGIAAARGEYIVLLNNDVVVTEGWLDGLLDAFDRVPSLGVSAPRSNRVAGNQQVGDAVYADISQMHAYARARRERFCGKHYLTDRAIGLCLCIDRRVIDAVGGIDEQFGAGNFEDDDFCLRVRAAGYAIAVCEDVFIHHFGSQTFAANKVDWAATMRENWGKFARKWGYSEVYPEQGYAPSEAISKGFDRSRHYVALPNIDEAHEARVPA